MCQSEYNRDAGLSCSEYYYQGISTPDISVPTIPPLMASNALRKFQHFWKVIFGRAQVERFCERRTWCPAMPDRLAPDISADHHRWSHLDATHTVWGLKSLLCMKSPKLLWLWDTNRGGISPPCDSVKAPGSDASGRFCMWVTGEDQEASNWSPLPVNNNVRFVGWRGSESHRVKESEDVGRALCGAPRKAVHLH